MSYIDRAVDEFLAWRLPADFSPDNGIVAHLAFRDSRDPNWPTGTNLLTAAQARAMFEHCIGECLGEIPQKDAVSKTESPSGDLITRLRATPNWKREEYNRSWKDMIEHYDRAPFEAADALENLTALLAAAQAENERLRTAAELMRYDLDERLENGDSLMPGTLYALKQLRAALEPPR